jgi:aryl-alcohol dehydrogenase-like predicted oxidoreductase
MEHRQLGRSGLTVSAIGLGCNNFGMRIDEAASSAVVHEALERGITLFDTAESYGAGRSEEFLGRALGKRRDEVVIATKFGMLHAPGPRQAAGSRREVIRACEASLRRLDTDVIDLYYEHIRDPRTPLEETLEALSELVRQGKVRYVGSSNVFGWQVADADHVARQHGLARFTACQFEWNLLQRSAETEVAPACRRFGVGIIPYFPLASGLLTGKYRTGQDFPAGSRLAEMPYFASIASPENLRRVERLSAVAEEHDHCVLELALSWLLAQKGVGSVIAGATSAAQVVANTTAADWILDDKIRQEVERALEPEPSS